MRPEMPPHKYTAFFFFKCTMPWPYIPFSARINGNVNDDTIRKGAVEMIRCGWHHVVVKYKYTENIICRVKIMIIINVCFWNKDWK